MNKSGINILSVVMLSGIIIFEYGLGVSAQQKHPKYEEVNSLPDEALGRLFEKELPKEPKLNFSTRTLTVLPDHRLVTSDIKGTVKLWNWKDKRKLKNIASIPREIGRVASSPDGSLLAAACYDGQIRVWEMKTLKLKYSMYAHKRVPLRVCFSSNGKFLASGGEEGGIRLWDSATGKSIRRWKAHSGESIYSMAFSPDDTMLATTHLRAVSHVWRVKDGKIIQSMKIRLNEVNDVCFTLDNRHLITAGSYDKLIRLWRISDGQQLGLFQGHDGHIQSIDLSSDGQTLVSAGSDGTIRFWEVLTQKEYRKYSFYGGKQEYVWSLGIHPKKNRLFASGEDGSVLIWPVRLLPKPTQLSDATLKTLWSDLAAADPRTAYSAIETLIVHPSQSLTLIESGMKAYSLDGSVVKKLIDDLDGKQFTVRNASFNRLLKMGRAVEGLLKNALTKTESAEQRRLLSRLLENIVGSAYSDQEIRLVRAVQVLEAIGNEKSYQLLKRLAKERKDYPFLFSILLGSVHRTEKALKE